MDLIKIIEIFAFVSGLIYIVLEIGQKNFMWILGIMTGVACAYSFGVQGLYASMGLNVYYVGVSFWGLVRWRRDSQKVQDGDIHLGRMTPGTMISSAVIFVCGTIALLGLLKVTGGSETWFDAVTAMLSAVATWWLVESYAEQWILWIVADLMSALLCAVSGLPWMAVLYLFYTASAVYGYVHWRRSGNYIPE